LLKTEAFIVQKQIKSTLHFAATRATIAACAFLLLATSLSAQQPATSQPENKPAINMDQVQQRPSGLGKQDQGLVDIAEQAKKAQAAGQSQTTQIGTKQPPQPPAPTVVLKPGEVPAIKFDTPIFDFGRVRSGQEIKHDFWFTNTGTGPLELTSVRPGCGCTTAGQHDRVVQPGKTGKIPIKLSTANFGGAMTKSITVTTNCTGAESSIQLQIKGELWQPVQITPMSASFGRVPQQSKDEGVLIRKLTIVNNVESKAKIDQIKVPSESFKAEAKELEPGKKFELIVSLMSPLKPGPIYGNIEMATGVPELPILKVPVNAFIVADVDVTPNQLSLPANRPSPLQRQLYVRNNIQTPVKVSDLKSSNPALKLDLRETQPGVAYLITVNVPVEYKPSLGGDKITFKTDHPSLSEVSVPVMEIVTSANRPPMPPAAPGMGTTVASPAVVPITPKVITPGQPQDSHAGHDHAGHDHGDHAGHDHAQPPAKAPGK
jgi:hypothetical protein